MRFNIYKDRQGYWRWKLLAANNRVIADSGEAYFNKQDCLHGIELVQSAHSAPIYEV